MIYFQKQFGLTVLIASAFTLLACATKAGHRGPPPNQQGGPQQARSSGTFLHPVGALFIRMDKDDNHLTSRAELKQGIDSEWALFGNKPSAVFFAQWSIRNLGSTDAMPNFMSFDRDFNGVISQTESSDQLTQEFSRLDKDNDGNVDRSEMLIAFAAPRGERSRKNEQGERPSRGQGGGRPPR